MDIRLWDLTGGIVAPDCTIGELMALRTTLILAHFLGMNGLGKQGRGYPLFCGKDVLDNVPRIGSTGLPLGMKFPRWSYIGRTRPRWSNVMRPSVSSILLTT